MASYIGVAPPTQTGIVNRYQYTGDGSTTVYSGNDNNGAELRYTSTNPILVYLNGVQLYEGTDYTKSSNTSVTFTTAPALNDTIEILTFGSFDLNAPPTLRNDLGIELSSGEILYGNTSNQTGKYALSGTSNEIEINTTSNTITLGLPDDVTIAGDLTVDTDTLYVDSTNNRVGIGQTSLTNTLHITKAALSGASYRGNVASFENSGNTEIQILSGSSSVGQLRFGDSDSDFRGAISYAHGDDEFQFWTSANKRVVIDSSGNIGVGTGTPTTSNNTTIALYNALRPSIKFNNSTTTNTSTTGSEIVLDYSPANLVLRNRESDGSITFETAGTNERVRIDESGYVGIGTTSPATALDVRSDGTSTDIQTWRSDLGTNDRAMVLRSPSSDSTTEPFVFQTGNSFAFMTDTDTVLTIADNRNVGIGTGSPQQKLHVSSGATNITARFQSSDAGAVIAFTDTGGSSWIGTNGSGEFAVATGGSANISANDATQNFTIDSSGQVGIGTTSPSTTLDVSGTVTATTFSGSGASLTSIPNSALDNSSITIAGDSGSDGVSLGETLTIAGGTGLTSTGSSNTVTIALDNTAVTAGSYGSSTAIPTFTVDAQGRLTAASTASISSDMSIAGDSGTDTITIGTDTFTIAGGTGLTSTASSNTITIDIDSTVATLTGTQTLTNKTLTSPAIDTSITHADNVKAYYGSSNDLAIYHDGSQSIIEDVGTGQLKILAENTMFFGSATGTETYMKGIKNGAVELYYDNDKKFYTHTAGANIDGRLRLDSISGTSNSGRLELYNTDHSSSYEIYNNTAGDLIFAISGTGGAEMALEADHSNYLNTTLSVGGREVVTVSSTQTLTNKTINTSNNTITIVEADISDLGSYVENVVEDTTPQLGGDLDLNSSDITGTGNINISGNITTSGNLTVNGTTTTLSTTNTTITDNLLELNSGATSNANDSGILIERGSTGDNAIMAWDESEDAFIFGTTTATASDTGNLTITLSPIQVRKIYSDSTLGDKISLYQNRFNLAGMYGFGVEANTLYYKSATNHRWYINANADGGTSDIMELTSSQLTVNADVKIEDATDSKLYFTDTSTGTMTLGYTGGEFYINPTSSATRSVKIENTGTGGITVGIDGKLTLFEGGAGMSLHYVSGDLSINPTSSSNRSVTFENTGTGTMTVNVDGDLAISTGSLSLGDASSPGTDNTLKLGASSDLRMYHTGSDSVIEDIGSGDLYIKASNNIYFQGYNSNHVTARLGDFGGNGFAELYYGNSKKIETTSAGATITGGATVTGDLTVDTDVLYVDSTNNRVGIGTTSPATNLDVVGTVYARSQLYTDNLRPYSGSLLTYGTGGTHYLNGNVGIGTSSPDNKLHVQNGDASASSNASSNLTIESSSSVNALQFLSPNTAQQQIRFGDPQDDGAGYIAYNHSGSYLSIGVNGPEKIRIDSSGNVGIGTSSPGGTLHVASTSGMARLALEAVTTNAKRFDIMSNVDGLVFRDQTAAANRIAIDGSGHLVPSTTNTYDLGTSSLVWRNLYTSDFHMSNEGMEKGNDIDGTKGSWTFQEGENDLFLINNKNGKKYKFNLTEVK